MKISSKEDFSNIKNSTKNREELGRLKNRCSDKQWKILNN